MMNYGLVRLGWLLAAMALVYPVYASWTMYSRSGLDQSALAAAVGQSVILILTVLYAGFSQRNASITFVLSVTFGLVLWVLGSFAAGGGGGPTQAAAVVFFAVAIWSAVEIMNRLERRRNNYLS